MPPASPLPGSSLPPQTPRSAAFSSQLHDPPLRSDPAPKEDDAEAQYAAYPTTPKSPRPITTPGNKRTVSYADKSFASVNTSVDDLSKATKNRGFWASFLFQNEGWTPLPLKPIFWVPYTLLLLGLAAALEIALYFSNQANGWPVEGDITDATDWLHYAVILPPAFTATAIVAVWAWTDMEIKKLQPYVDLIHGDSVAKRSLLLDYTRSNNFISWLQAFGNKHYLVGGATILALITLVFQPLASALVTVHVVWEWDGVYTTQNRQAISLNQDADFEDLTSFLTAAGYASASVLYDVGDLPFVLDHYTVGEFNLPRIDANGTAIARVPAVKSATGCQTADVELVPIGDGSWTNTASLNGCSRTFNVSRVAISLFGTDTVECDPSQPESTAPDQFKPILFWFFTYEPQAAAAAALCYPSFSIVDVDATVDLKTSNLTKVEEIGPFTLGNSNFSDYAANVTDAPLNGRAYNGIAFNLTDPDPFVLDRANATRLQLPAAAFQLAKQDPDEFIDSFQSGKIVQWVDQVYSTYLNLIARKIYFRPVDLALSVEAKTLQNRAFLSAPAVHVLTVAFILVGLGSAVIQLLHFADRRDLALKHEPGTLASAIYVGAETPFAALIADRETDKQVKDAVKQARFRLDPQRNKVLMSGEVGYDGGDEIGHLAPPKLSKRDSLVATLSGHGNRHSQRWNRNPRRQPPGSPLTPNPPTPSTPRSPSSSAQRASPTPSRS